MAIMYSEDIGFLSSYPKSEFDKTYHLHKYVSQDILNKGKLLVTGRPGCGKTLLAAEIIRAGEDMYDEIYHVVFDKEKYLYYDGDTRFSIDCILKKSIIRAVSATVGCLDGSEFEHFEESLGKNTLIVVDNYDIKSMSPYMRHIVSGKCDVVVVSRCNIDCSKYGFDIVNIECENPMSSQVFCELCNKLDACQKELLMSLASMLYYLCDCTKVVSGNSGFFDRASVKYYFDGIYESLDRLIDLNLVKERCDGKIFMERNVCELVFSHLKPSADNCKTLMKAFGRETGFVLSQSVKNTFARAYSEYDAIPETVKGDELSELYTYFVLTDENSLNKLYNIMFVKALHNLASCGENSYTHHLLTRNTGFLLDVMYYSSNTELVRRIYTDGDSEELCTDDADICYLLDIVRLCVSFLRNLPTELYDANYGIMKLLCRVMEKLYHETADKECHAEILDRVVETAWETFCYFSVIDAEGNYYSFREKSTSVIRYTGNCFTDDENAVGLSMGYSPYTLNLYRVFGKYLEKSLSIHKGTDKDERILVSRRKNILRLMYTHFHRIVNGFDNFYDFFENKQCLFCDLPEADVDKRLSDNRRFVSNGYDGGTKIGGVRYAEKIMIAVRQSKNPYGLVRIVLNPNYNVSDECYGSLFEKGFVKFVVGCNNMSNHARQNLVLWLVDNYNENAMKDKYKRLIQELVSMLLLNVSSTEVFEDKLRRIVSSMYFENKTCCANNIGFADNLYMRYCYGKKRVRYSDDEYISEAVCNFLNFGKQPSDKSRLSSAFENASYHYLTNKSDFDAEGFFKLCVRLCGFEKAYVIYLKTNMYFYKAFPHAKMLEMKE